jgi:hypothetical protein
MNIITNEWRVKLRKAKEALVSLCPVAIALSASSALRALHLPPTTSAEAVAAAKVSDDKQKDYSPHRRIRDGGEGARDDWSADLRQQPEPGERTDHSDDEVSDRPEAGALQDLPSQ